MTERGVLSSRRDARAAGLNQSQCRGGGDARGYAAFTLIELLVTISIIAILLSLVLPMLGHTVAASRGFKCQQSLRSVAYDFQIFADDNLHGNRGTGDGQDIPSNRFTLENFVESQYSVHEFWEWPGEVRHDLPDASGNDPMRCTEVPGPITLRRDVPCSQGAVSPHQNVSFGFNIRLRISTQNTELQLTSGDIAAAGSAVPLVWDVDGVEAASRGQSPHFSGPSLGSTLFGDDRYWFPGMRHNGTANFAFTDGHVESSARPLAQVTWDWVYTPRR